MEPINPTKLKIIVFIYNIKMVTLFPIKRWLRRKLVMSLNLNRPFNYPFLSGDAFRAISQHIFDTNSDLNPISVNLSDIIFVGADFIHDFFKNKHPFIKNKYILITLNGDPKITEDYIKYLDEKILHWFAQNLIVKHDKITPIPIGLVNMYCNKIGTISDLENNINNPNKEHGMSYGFSMDSGTERIALKKILEIHKYAHNIFGYDQKKYFKKMSQYSFTISPEGNGPDCHRTWEAMYLNVIPIVKRNPFIEYFKNLGLPILIIDNWEEIENMDEVYLKNTYNQIMTNADHKALYMDFWLDLIISKKIHN